jgi:hypothetical protein
MAEIKQEVKKELNSFELSELTRVLEGIEAYLLYCSGLSKICGGFSNAEAYEIEDSDDYDDDTDEWIDYVLIEVETGEFGEGFTSSTKVTNRISKKILGDKNLSLKEKLDKVMD